MTSLISTMMTLFVVPCAYSLLARLESPRRGGRQAEVRAALARPHPGEGH